MNYAELTNHITNLMSQDDIELKEMQHTDTSATTSVFSLIADSEIELVKNKFYITQLPEGHFSLRFYYIDENEPIYAVEEVYNLHKENADKNRELEYLNGYVLRQANTVISYEILPSGRSDVDGNKPSDVREAAFRLTQKLSREFDICINNSESLSTNQHLIHQSTVLKSYEKSFLERALNYDLLVSPEFSNKHN